MTASRTNGTEAWTSWLSSFPLCCAPLTSPRDNKRQGRSKSLSATSRVTSKPLGMMSDEELLISKDYDEKNSTPVVYDQPFPQPHPHPVAGPGTEKVQQSFGERVSRKSTRSGRKSSSVRKRFWSSSSRPQISLPSNFRHISSASPSAPYHPTTPPPRLRPAKQLRPRSFRPLELSIYMPEQRVSPILPHFEFPSVTPPPPVYNPSYLEEDRPLVHQKSVSSSMSFHLPRRQPWDSSPSSTQNESSTQDEELPPLIPPKSRSRNRAYTSSDVESIKERVASAMAEVDKLQKQIDDVIERQSLYASSRPSTSHSMAHTMPGKLLMYTLMNDVVLIYIDLEPMPSIPALPPAAPSFAERLNSDIARPHTAPIKAPMLGPPRRIRTPEEVSAAFKAPPKIRRDDDRPLPPPLPLVLRPPLRKKKSFSRVSNWLFPGAEHNRDVSIDSVTNVPRPIKGNEGFYQCASQDEAPKKRRSVDSIDTMTTWESDEERTAPTAYSPGSTPATKQEDSFLSRTMFGKNDSRPRRTSVGVAY